ncbi:MAG: ribose-phosphate pyrophosphokinase [Bradymonadales bacterium]|nr:MAG: ribose-phosphate pyrophosphokinase [Bradymonadales bacterium]
MPSGALKVFCGQANASLAASVAKCLDIPLGKAEVKSFSDGESSVRVLENVRGANVFVIQSTSSPANDHLMELLLMADALRRASARQITAVIPYYGYARQDRKDSPRTPISARLVADLIETAGFNRVFSLDLHAAQIQGFFKVPVDHLFAAPVLLEEIRKVVTDETKLVLVSPDAGSVERTRAFAKRLKSPLAIVDKRRAVAGQVAEVNIIGDVSGREAVLVDDLVDTAGTICEVAKTIVERGATKVWAVATHPVLSGPALERIEASPLERLLVTDTIPLRPEAQASAKVKLLSVAPLLAEGIRRIHGEASVSELFV